METLFAFASLLSTGEPLIESKTHFEANGQPEVREVKMMNVL